MSGIFGVVLRGGQRLTPSVLEEMSALLEHRGPDGSALWTGDGVGLGHRMLRATPESLHERQPLTNRRGDLTVTADARLDNRDELIARLGLADGTSHTVADGEIVLAAYDTWGEECPAYLLGDFAFAIWDERRQTLFCARDHFGVRPFYYHLSADVFAFATELKALFAVPGVPRQVNAQAIADCLAATVEDATASYYEGILRLPPAHAIAVSPDGVRLRPYWALDPHRELRLRSDGEYAEAVRAAFFEAVRCRMRSAFPVGSMLSGGIDSSSVTCTAGELMSRSQGDRLHTFSAVFDTVAASDERSYQRTVLDKYDVVAHTLHGDTVSPVEEIDQMIWHLDQALTTGHLYVNWNLLRTAREHGVRVVLDGFDGDTTISHGRGIFRELASSGQWLTLARATRAYGNRWQRPWRPVFVGWAMECAVSPLVERHGALRRARNLVRGLRTRQTAAPTEYRAPWQTIVRCDVARRFDLDTRVQQRAVTSTTEREAHHQLLTWPVMPLILEVLDHTSAAFGVDLRFPFWDKRLVELCLSLPANQKLDDGWTRVVMRRAMEGILPTEVQWRLQKTTLHPSFEYGLRSFGQSVLEQGIASEALAEYVEVGALRDIFDRLISEARVDEEEVNALWRAASVGLWLDRHHQAPKFLGKEGSVYV